MAGRSPELVREEHLRQIEDAMTKIRDLATQTGLNREQILEMWDLMWEENQ